MSVNISKLEELFAIRLKERRDEQIKLIKEMTQKVDSLLGSRLMLAIDQSAESNWEIESTNAIRNFWFKGGKFSMVVYAVFDSTDTDVEIQTAEPQFERLIKKTNITSVCEDWFLNSIETLFIEMKSRIKTSANKE